MTLESWIVPENRRVASPNYSPGRGSHHRAPDVLCLHYAVDRIQKVDDPEVCDEQARLWGDPDPSEDCMDVARYFARKGARASAHFVIGRDGSLAQCVSLRDTAWHAGGGALPQTGHGPLEKPRKGDFNRRSIGIELCNAGWAVDRIGVPNEHVVELSHPATPRKVQRWEHYTLQQRDALATVLNLLQWKAPSLRWVCGHEDVVNRDTLGRLGGKTDPGPAFPWYAFDFSMFGLTRVVYDFVSKEWVRT